MTKKLHVLFINGWYPSRVLPTNGDFIQRHAEAVALQHQVTSIHVISDLNNTHKIHITDITVNGVRTLIGYVKSSNNSLIRFFRFYTAYKNILKRVNHYDIIHVNELYPVGIIALFLKYFKNKSYIISEHWTGYQQLKKFNFLRKKLSVLITKNASFICPVSNDLAVSMQSLGLKGTYKRIPNVVDTFIFKPIDSYPKIFTMVHISNMLNDHKNVIGILEVLADLKKEKAEFQFKLIGENSSQYKAKVRELKMENEVEFIDHIPHSKIPFFIQNAHLLVMFSNYENLPCVILESFACGTPVIATDVGGISEFFPDEFGYLIPKKNKELLKSTILKIYNSNNSIDKKKMHQYAKSNFSPEIIGKNFSELYKKVLIKQP